MQARKVSTSDIQLVQNLIERCLQMYLSQREVIATLQSQAKIEPGFTGLVWQVHLPTLLPRCSAVPPDLLLSSQQLELLQRPPRHARHLPEPHTRANLCEAQASRLPAITVLETPYATDCNEHGHLGLPFAEAGGAEPGLLPCVLHAAEAQGPDSAVQPLAPAAGQCGAAARGRLDALIHAAAVAARCARSRPPVGQI